MSVFCTANVTGRFDVVEAVSRNAAVPSALSPGFAKVIVCGQPVMLHVPAPLMATLVVPFEVVTEQVALDVNVTGSPEPPPVTPTVNGTSPYVFTGLLQLEERPVMVMACTAFTIVMVTTRCAAV